MNMLWRIGASTVAMMAALMSGAAAISSHIRTPREFVQRPPRGGWIGHPGNVGPSGAKHRRKAAERTFGLSPRGY